MPDAQQLSEARRALLEKYRRGEMGSVKANATAATISTEQATNAVVQDIPEKPAIEAVMPSLETRVSIVPIQTQGSQRPFFYFHVHWMGGAFYCFNMAHYLGKDQPFYVFEPYKIDGLSIAQLPSLEKMAADYLEAIRRIQPEGPYLMGGFCGGGLIAFEIAHQIQAMGESADLVVLIEPRAGPAPRRLIGPKIFHGLIRGVGRMIHTTPDQQFNVFIRLRHIYLTFRYKQYRLDNGFNLFPGINVLHKDWMAKFLWIISAYNPREYQGKATYFWAQEKPGHRRAGWGQGAKASQVEIHIIPGTHDTCRTDHLAEMTAELKICLETAQRI